MPIEIQSGKPIAVNIRLSGNGWNEVGIRCTPVVWQALLHGQPDGQPDGLTVRLVSSSTNGTQIAGVSLGGPKNVGGIAFPEGYKIWPVDSFHALFEINGERDASASVEITFKNAPEAEGEIHAEILVLKTPIDTKFPNF
jgi:hypothetical protein